MMTKRIAVYALLAFLTCLVSSHGHESHWPAVEALRAIYQNEVRLVIPGEILELEEGTYGTLWIEGTLRIPRDVDLTANVRTIVIAPSGFLDGGTENDPVLGNVQIVFRDLPFAVGDTFQLANGLLSFGKIRLYGHEKTAWTRFSGTVPTNDFGWQPGDQLYLPDVAKMHHYAYPNITDPREDGLYTITASGLDRPLAFPRVSPGYGIDPIIANMTRNITFASENPNGVRGHCQLFDHGDCDMAYVVFLGMGRTTGAPTGDGTGINQIGRYGLHLHHYWGPIGGRSDSLHQATFKGVVVDGLNHVSKWGIVIHQSHWVRFEDCITIRNRAGLVTEDGVEVGWEVDHLLSGWNKEFIRESSEVRKPLNQLGTGGAGAWLRSTAGTLTDSAFVNNTMGLTTAQTVTGSIQIELPKVPLVTTLVPSFPGGPPTLPISPRQSTIDFSGNQFICNLRNGIDCWGSADSRWDGVPRLTEPYYGYWVGEYLHYPVGIPVRWDDCTFAFNGRAQASMTFTTNSNLFVGCKFIASRREVRDPPTVQGIDDATLTYPKYIYVKNCDFINMGIGGVVGRATIYEDSRFDCSHVGILARYTQDGHFQNGMTLRGNIFSGGDVLLHGKQLPVDFSLEDVLPCQQTIEGLVDSVEAWRSR